MAFRAFLLVGLLCGFSFIFPETAWAKPKHATFEEMIEKSDTIVVARFLGEQPDKTKHTIQVAVIQALKGDLKPGNHQFPYEDRPHFDDKGEEFVAFLDKDGVWRFMASALRIDEIRVDQGLLRLSGFYDKNAYLVTPGLITLDQLKTYLKEGSLVYRFRGDIYFPEPAKANWKPGSLVISGTYDAINEKVNVKGLPNLKGFPAQPDVFINHYGDSNLELSYSRLLYRPLELIGKVQGLDKKTGEMKVRFAVTTPDVLTQRAFEDYLADASRGTCYYKFKLACDPARDSIIPKIVFVTSGKRTDHEWDSIDIEGIGKSSLHVFGTSYNGPNSSSVSFRIGYPAISLLPQTMIDEGSKRDWVLRMNLKTEAGDYLTIGFQIGERTQDDNGFFLDFQGTNSFTEEFAADLTDRRTP